MSVKRSFVIEAESSRVPQIEAKIIIREDGYINSLELWRDNKCYTLPFHFLEDIVDLIDVLASIVTDVKGIDNGSLFNK